MATSETLSRYARQVRLPEVGLDGQRRLGSASVLVVGAGGLGCPALTYLAAAGVGRLGVVDFDRVEESNLHRQPLYSAADIGRPKVEVAGERLRELNPDVEVVAYDQRLDAENAMELLGRHDLVIDGTDTFQTRYLINDTAVHLGVPNVYASIGRFEGQASVLGSPGGPCYRCLFPHPPPPGLIPDCADGGVLGVLPGLMGTVQATEALKLLLDIGDPLIGRLLMIDALSMMPRSFHFERDPGCPTCGTGANLLPLSPPRSMATVPELSVHDLKERLDRGDEPFILDVREPSEYEAANLGGALIPLGELPARVDEIREHQHEDVVVHCRSGGRSARAVEILRNNGFSGAVNLKGGIHAWSDEIDPSLPKP